MDIYVRMYECIYAATAVWSSTSSLPYSLSLHDVSLPLCGCGLISVRKIQPIFFTLLFSSTNFYFCVHSTDVEKERGVRKKCSFTYMMNEKKHPEIHKQFCHWVESPSVTYKKVCACAFVRAWVRVCVKFRNKLDRFTYEWCWMKNNKSMILISISETGCYDKRSESNFSDSQYACAMRTWGRKKCAACERAFEEKWMEMRARSADDDDGGNASAFENKWQHTHNHVCVCVFQF